MVVKTGFVGEGHILLFFIYILLLLRLSLVVYLCAEFDYISYRNGSEEQERRGRSQGSATFSQWQQGSGASANVVQVCQERSHRTCHTAIRECVLFALFVQSMNLLKIIVYIACFNCCPLLDITLLCLPPSQTQQH